MSQVNFNNQNTQTQATQGAGDIDFASLLSKLGVMSDGTVVPPAKDGKPGTSSAELPVLPKPSLAAGSSLALEILMEAIGAEVQRSEIKAGMAGVKANNAQREAANKEKLAKIEEQIKNLEEAGIWDKIGNVFKYIGMALAAVACVAMIATGVGSAAGVAGLVLIGLSLANSVLDAIGEAVDGQGWGLTSWAGKLIEKISGSEEAGMWVKLGLDLAISVAALICTCGASSSSLAGQSVEKVNQIAQTVSKIASISKTIMDVGGAGTKIASAVYTKDSEDARAAQKRLEAILEKMQMLNDIVTQHMKTVIEDGQKVTDTVNEIVKENVQTQTAILTGGGAQAMA